MYHILVARGLLTPSPDSFDLEALYSTLILEILSIPSTLR